MAVKTIRFDRNAQLDSEAQFSVANFYTDPNGQFRAGLWSGKVGSSNVHYKKNELCTILEGEVRLTDEAGESQVYKAGDTFVIPNGFKGVWENVLPVRKFFAVHEVK